MSLRRASEPAMPLRLSGPLGSVERNARVRAQRGEVWRPRVAGEAWALHQIGSSALAIGNFVAARSALEAAAHIRALFGRSECSRGHAA